MDPRPACPSCGAEVDPASARCPTCDGPEAIASPRPSGSEEQRLLGLRLFEAEESLARGAPDKALVLASRLVKEHPDSLTARALVERARRELLRGRRREKLESRLREAEGFLKGGDLASAERIVNSALKLIPDHALALGLFAQLKERRLGAGTAEAEAERELLALARTQARRALEDARSALAAGWGRKAALAVRRGLRLVPDDPDLLALLRETQGRSETLDASRAKRHALHSQVRAAEELLARGRLEEALLMLRAILNEDPDNVRAQAAVQEVRRAWLARSQPAAEAPPVTPPVPEIRLRREPAPPPTRPVPGRSTGLPGEAPRGAIPTEILLPRTRRRATPAALIVGTGSLFAGLLFWLANRGALPLSPPGPPPSAPPVTVAPPSTLAGPLSRVDPDLRLAVERTLTAYAQALERGDASLLERARPDLTSAQREARIAPFRGALNATTDVRVLDARMDGERGTVQILASDVIVGAEPRPPVEETLRFERVDNGWRLVAERAAPARR